ncbi:MAG: PD40 domain-containing protein [Bryobacterales bacterium]|nr:PD40 domain-containing protein [Bryobacterales bacterium]
MRTFTRRAFLSLPLAGAAFAANKGQTFPIEGVRYADPSTEFPVERLTDPKYSSYWPNPYARAIARKGVFFLYSCDRGEGMQAFRYELRSGESKQLTEAKELRTETLHLLPDDRAFAYVDGRSVFVAPFAGLREREVYRIADGWEMGEGFSVSGDGIYAVLAEKQGAKSRLRLIGMAKGNVTTLVEHDGVLAHPQARPRRASVLYQRDDQLCLINYDGQNNIALAKIHPSPGAVLWSPDGRTVQYLDPGSAMREVTPDTRQDRLIAKTSQFANMSRNIDGSVFVAASRSKAQPFILLMVRTVKRELAICEHRASEPANVAPVFSPTSQRIYFQSDRDGKPAIYSVVVDKFIEKTETES